MKDHPKTEGVRHDRKESQESAAQNCGEEAATILNRRVTGPESKGKLHKPQDGGRVKALQIRLDGFYCEVQCAGDEDAEIGPFEGFD